MRVTKAWLPYLALAAMAAGVIAVGADLPAALALAGEIEYLAAQYCTALAVGDVRILDECEMRRVVEKFRTYGKQDAPDSGLVFGGGDIPSGR